MSSTLHNSLIASSSETLRAFIKDVGLPSNIAPEALGMKPTEYMRWLSNQNANAIREEHIVSLGQFLNIDESLILEGSYDRDFVRSRIFEGPEALPDQYAQNQFSYLRSSAHIIKYLTLTRGQHYSDMILRKLNISPLFYSNLDNKISINYFVDLLEILFENGMNQNELDNLAGVLFLGLEGTVLGNKFKKAQSYFECYEVLAQNIQLFDSNFDYQFELDKTQVLIKSNFFFDKHFHQSWTPEKMMRLIRYRQILSGWYPFLAKLPPIFPQHTLKVFPNRIESCYLIKFDEKIPTRLLTLSSNSKLQFV